MTRATGTDPDVPSDLAASCLGSTSLGDELLFRSLLPQPEQGGAVVSLRPRGRPGRALLDAIADRVTRVATVTVRPDVDTVLGEVGRGRLVFGVRFHAAIAGLLAGRPGLAAPYSSTVSELAADAPRTIHQLRVPLTRVQPRHAEEALAVGDHHRAAELAALVDRERGNGELLDTLLEAV